MNVEERSNNGGRWHDKSAITKASFSTKIVSLHDSDHDGVVRIFAGHSEMFLCGTIFSPTRSVIIPLGSPQHKALGAIQ